MMGKGVGRLGMLVGAYVGHVHERTYEVASSIAQSDAAAAGEIAHTTCLSADRS
jgi:hypothetical protein